MRRVGKLTEQKEEVQTYNMELSLVWTGEAGTSIGICFVIIPVHCRLEKWEESRDAV